jgi:hypothetical protein
MHEGAVLEGVYILLSLRLPKSFIYTERFLSMPISDPVQEFLQLPVPLQATIALLGLIAIQQLRQGHIGRVGIASAGVLIFGTAYPIWNQLATMWRLYTAIAVVFAVIAGLSYLTKTSLSTGFYKIALLLYGGGPIIMIFLYGFPL